MTQLSPKQLAMLRDRDPGAPTRFCPDDSEMAAAFGGQGLSDHQLRHMAECRWCQARVGVLARVDANAETDDVPGEWLASAKQLGRDTSRPSRRPVWAAAAVLLLAVGLTVDMSMDRNDPAEGATGLEPMRDVRNLQEPGQTIELLTPAEGAVLDLEATLVEWTEVGGALHYEVTLLADDGAIVARQRQAGTQWRPGAVEGLEPGRSFYVQVEAQLPDSRTVNSGHVAFSTTGEARE